MKRKQLDGEEGLPRKFLFCNDPSVVSEENSGHEHQLDLMTLSPDTCASETILGVHKSAVPDQQPFGDDAQQIYRTENIPVARPGGSAYSGCPFLYAPAAITLTCDSGSVLSSPPSRVGTPSMVEQASSVLSSPSSPVPTRKVVECPGAPIRPRLIARRSGRGHDWPVFDLGNFSAPALLAL